MFDTTHPHIWGFFPFFLFASEPFISSSFIRIFPLLSLLGQDQGVKLGLRKDAKRGMVVAMMGCGSLGLNNYFLCTP